VIPGVAIVGAVRLAKPTSLWARRFYDSEKIERSQARVALHHDRYTHLFHRVSEAIGGAPRVQPPQGPTH
jgi:hypothetical protein